MIRDSSGLITSPPYLQIRMHELLPWERQWNRKLNSFRAPVERAVVILKA